MCKELDVNAGMWKVSDVESVWVQRIYGVEDVEMRRVSSIERVGCRVCGCKGYMEWRMSKCGRYQV